MGDASWIEQLPLEFWLSAAFGSLATILYAIDQFARPTFQQQSDRPETTFAPAELTSGSDYIISFCLYLAGLLAFYWLVCLIGPAPFAGAGLTGDADIQKLEVPGSFPLWVAMVLIGVLPHMPVLSEIEQSWRKLMHTRARIPQAVLLRSRDIRSAEYSFVPFEPLVRRGEGLFARNVTLPDLVAERTSASYRWARLSAILQQLSVIDAYPEAAKYVSPEFLERHHATLAGLTADYITLADKIERERAFASGAERAGRLEVVAGAAVYDRDGAGMQPDVSAAARVPDRYSNDIEALLRRASMFLACAIVAVPESARNPALAMQAFGFQPMPSADVTSEVDVVIKALIVALLVYCLFVFLAFRIAPVLPDWMGATGWPLPGKGNDRLQIIFTFALPQFASIGSALMLRYAFRRQHLWFRNGAAVRALPSPKKYVAVALVSFVVALVMSSYLAGAWQGLAKAFDDFYWRFFEGFVPATSAVFLCLAIDGVIVGWGRRNRNWIAALHAVIATLIALGAADHFYTSDRNFTGAILYSAASTFIYASALSVAILFLASRSELLNDVDEEGAE